MKQPSDRHGTGVQLIGEIPGHTILGFLDNAVARNGIVKQLIKFVKKDTVSAQPVLASSSKATNGARITI